MTQVGAPSSAVKCRRCSLARRCPRMMHEGSWLPVGVDDDYLDVMVAVSSLDASPYINRSSSPDTQAHQAFFLLSLLAVKTCLSEQTGLSLGGEESSKGRVQIHCYFEWVYLTPYLGPLGHLACLFTHTQQPVPVPVPQTLPIETGTQKTHASSWHDEAGSR